MKNIIKNNGKTIFVIALLLIAYFLAFEIFSTYSRYMTDSLETGSIRSANWSFKINDSLNTTQSITLVADNGEKIVPGSTGVIELNVDYTETEVALLYTIIVSSTNLPPNLKLYTDSTYTKEFTSFSKTVNISELSTKDVVYIYWKWNFTDDDENAWQGKSLSVDLQAEASQVIANE